MLEAGMELGAAETTAALSPQTLGIVARGRAPIHHLATAKNWISKARGGPWSPKFSDIFKRAGMSLEDAANKVAVPGHRGPHPEAYHKAVFERVTAATEGLEGDAYSAALKAELDALGAEAATPGTMLNKLLTGL
jgi:hypothetical protein